MNSSAFASHIALASDDLRLLQGVLETWCRARQVDRGSAQAQTAGRALVDWFQFGVTEPAQLLALLEPLEELAN